ncbi:MAG: hypothetical protein HKM26_00405, partial [Winogradskyella sp.]|nr:hypothetical protein [Winogradskyella sp.]
MKKIIFYILGLIPLVTTAQDQLKGVVYELTEAKTKQPLPGANVYWLNTTVGAMTDIDGEFSIP